MTEQNNSGKRQRKCKRRSVWFFLPVALLCTGYVWLVVLLVQTPGVLPERFAQTVINYLLLGVVMALPLCLTVIAGIILVHTPHVTDKKIQTSGHGRVLWFRVDLPDNGVGGTKREQQ